MKVKRIVAIFCAFACSMPAVGATAVFAPAGPTQVPRGEQITFAVTLTASASGFNSADVVIGSNTVADIAFAYSPAWISSFANVTSVSYDNSFYGNDVYVGGNNPSQVGQSLLLGTITIDTAGTSVGDHSIVISHAMDGISMLGLNGVPDPLAGTVTFQVTPPIPAVSTWGAIVISLGMATLGTVVLRRSPFCPP